MGIAMRLKELLPEVPSGKSFLSRDPTAVIFLWQEHLEFHHDAHRDPAAVVFLIALQAT